MNKFIKDMLELGADLELSCSRLEKETIIKEAEELYEKHLIELKQQEKRDE